MSTSDVLTIRSAQPSDIPTILNFIQQLADYEKLRNDCVATEEALQEALFGKRPYAEVLLAFWNDRPAGFALFFHNFSTFLAKPGIYLEDLFVNQELRGNGIGKALLVQLATLAVERNCGRLEWSVLKWNKPSIDFYDSLGAKPLNEWLTYRLTGSSLEQLANSSGPK